MESGTTPIKRKLDELGRFVIPKDMRNLLGINKNDLVLVTTDGDSVIIKPLTLRCPICKKPVQNNKCVCDSCIADIKAM